MLFLGRLPCASALMARAEHGQLRAIISADNTIALDLHRAQEMLTWLPKPGSTLQSSLLPTAEKQRWPRMVSPQLAASHGAFHSFIPSSVEGI